MKHRHDPEQADARLCRQGRVGRGEVNRCVTSELDVWVCGLGVELGCGADVELGCRATGSGVS